MSRKRDYDYTHLHVRALNLFSLATDCIQTEVRLRVTVQENVPRTLSVWTPSLSNSSN